MQAVTFQVFSLFLSNVPTFMNVIRYNEVYLLPHINDGVHFC